MEEQLKEIIEMYKSYTLEELKAKYEEIRLTPGYVRTKGLTLVAIKQLIEEKER